MSPSAKNKDFTHDPRANLSNNFNENKKEGYHKGSPSREGNNDRGRSSYNDKNSNNNDAKKLNNNDDVDY